MSHGLIDQKMSFGLIDQKMSFGLIYAQLDMDPAIEPEFNDWYDTEHIPERLAIPGFLTGRRAERTDPRPRYIALYDLETLAVLDTGAYLSKQGDRRTPWTARMLRLTKTFSRRLYEQRVPGAERVDIEDRFTVLRFVSEAERVAAEQHVTELRSNGVHARLFEGKEKAAGEWLVLATLPDEAAAKRTEAASALGRVERYGPYLPARHEKRFACRTL